MRYICDIVPLTHLPLTREQFLWYTSATALTPGTVVRVPLFRRAVRGVVLRCYTDHTQRRGNIRLKAVYGAVDTPPLTDAQLALAQHIAATTFTSLGTVMALFVPRPTAQRAKSAPPLTLAPMRTTAAMRTLATQIMTDGARYHLLRDTPHMHRDALYAALIRRCGARKQVLIIAPEILRATEIAARLRATYGDRVALVHAKCADGDLYDTYCRAHHGDVRIIVGTKKALFMPLRAPGVVIIDEEHDISLKQWDRAPRFDVRTIASHAARNIYRCPLVAVSSAPRITRTVPTPLGPAAASPGVEVVNMRAVHYERCKESKRKKVRPTLFAPILLDAIRDAIAHHRKALLFFNHKGMSAFSLCERCGALLACPECDRALVLAPDGTYECLHCTFRTDVFARCAQCDNMSFRNIGYGTAKIAQMLAKEFPTARIARIDGHSMRTRSAARDTLVHLTDDTVDIIIGTQMALRPWHNAHIGVAAILDADALLTIPDLFADERLFAFGANAAACGARTFIQTYNPGYHIYDALRTLRYDTFRRRILADRRALRYPPYCRMVKIVFQHKKCADARSLAETWHTRFCAIDALCVSAPHTPLLPKVRGLFRHQILLRFGTRDTAPLPPQLTAILPTLPPRTIIDIDPVALV